MTAHSASTFNLRPPHFVGLIRYFMDLFLAVLWQWQPSRDDGATTIVS